MYCFVLIMLGIIYSNVLERIEFTVYKMSLIMFKSCHLHMLYIVSNNTQAGLAFAVNIKF